MAIHGPHTPWIASFLAMTKRVSWRLPHGSSLRGAQRRGNPWPLDRFVPRDDAWVRHCEERSDVAIHDPWIASLRSQ